MSKELIVEYLEEVYVTSVGLLVDVNRLLHVAQVVQFLVGVVDAVLIMNFVVDLGKTIVMSIVVVILFIINVSIMLPQPYLYKV